MLFDPLLKFFELLPQLFDKSLFLGIGLVPHPFFDFLDGTVQFLELLVPFAVSQGLGKSDLVGGIIEKRSDVIGIETVLLYQFVDFQQHPLGP